MILGFKNIKDALAKKVKEAYKIPLELVCEMHTNSDAYHEGKAVYISGYEIKWLM